MATLAMSPRLPTRTPGRPSRVRSTTEAAPATEPPHKKRKYIPGGPGGGGRWLDADGNPMAGRPAGFARSAPRVRSVRTLIPKTQKVERDGGAEAEADGDGEQADTPVVARSAVQTRPRRERTERPVPRQATPRPRYSNAAAAAAASQASDGYKPREERSWEDFHPDLDIDADLFVFDADQVDGRKKQENVKVPLLNNGSMGEGESKAAANADIGIKDGSVERGTMDPGSVIHVTPSKRKPGRPPRKPESMLSGLGSPPMPRILPLPTHNPKERLNLPKPSFRQFNHFLQYEEDQKENKVNYVDRTMSNVGYQESDRFELPSKVLVRLTETQHLEDEAEVSLRLESDGPAAVTQAAPTVGKVEYDMDEQDVAWLEELNVLRQREGVDAIKPAILEITLTQIEKEYHALEKRIPKPQPRHAQTHRPRSSSQAAVNGDPVPHPSQGDEPDSKCSICDDGDCENANAIIFCDGCDLAVHQECYGVPFIPEGQWFCRKCKEIGRGTPTCIFCPNVDGAFKQTNTLRWSHLLCSIWIPEVTIANMTFMEPITDVEKVPKSRWKLQCYICNQKMGACIQCGNKNCYLAFHVTCARRAKLFLKMKSPQHQGIDATGLKAFCDRHVPAEWGRTHDTDHAIVEAKRFYRMAMKDRTWAEGDVAPGEVVALGPPLLLDGTEAGGDDTIAVRNRRRAQPAKLSWRLPSGAPVVPAVVFTTVDASLARFTIRKRKEFVERACKYWTLKREARRGAALLKRLQLQLESFSSMEITRRDFAGMGEVDRPRLQRRIAFAEMLQEDMGHLTALCAAVKERETLRLKEVELLRELVDTVYFPVTGLVAPILLRAQRIDANTRLFKSGFDILAHRMRERFYTSVADFSHDLSYEVNKVLADFEPGYDTVGGDIGAIHEKLYSVAAGTPQHLALGHEHRHVKALAKRLVKAVKEMLEDAVEKEAKLNGREQFEELAKLDSMGIFASTRSSEDAQGSAFRKPRSASIASAVAGASPLDEDVQMRDAAEDMEEATNLNHTKLARDKELTPASKATSCTSSSHDHGSNLTINKPPTEPLSPPISHDSHPAIGRAPSPIRDTTSVFAQGGIPWYLEPFDPSGTTVHDERYMGRAVMRDMSEELSDMDEGTLMELEEAGKEATPVPTKGMEAKTPVTAKKAAKKKGRRRW